MYYSIWPLFVVTVTSLDDTTLGLMARVDPANPTILSGFVETGTSSSSLSAKAVYYDESSGPFSGLQIAPLEREKPKKKILQTDRRKILHVNRVHLHDAPSLADPADVTPDIYICNLPAGQNKLSGRACDLVGSSSNAVISQTLHCAERMHPNTVAELLMGAQTVPIDFGKTAEQAMTDLAAMDRPVPVEISLGSCAQGGLLDTALDRDHVVFVIVNPDVQRAADTFKNLGLSTRTASFRAGLVVVDTRMLFDKKTFKGELATRFKENVAKCHADGICTSKELVEWVPSGEKRRVDWFAGTSECVVKFVQ